MKKLPLILNLVLAIAVIVLYILFFNSKPSKTASEETVGLSGLSAATEGVVFVNIDSVFANYKMYDDVVGDLEKKLNTAEAQLQSQQRTFEKNYNDYMYKAERGLVTRSEAAQIEQNLQQEQQSLMGLQNQLQYNLAEEQQVAQRKVLNSIVEYLKTMEGVEKYQYILGNAFGGNIWYANQSLDITRKVIDGLNANYEKTLKDESKKK
ncbi:MAG: OmpH family outer membrane protein [Bacteroidales bacterium]|nr:OmpH family outer membrane protein [Bacteroidales bacterium]